MDKPAPDRVGYVFARTELNITTWVHKRLVDVGVLSNLDWINPVRMPPAFSQDFRVIGRSEDVPRALMPVSYTHLDVYKRQPHVVGRGKTKTRATLG